jgi:hypothetical protein
MYVVLIDNAVLLIHVFPCAVIMRVLLVALVHRYDMRCVTLCVCVCVYMYVCMSSCVVVALVYRYDMRTCTYVDMRTCTYVDMRTCTYVDMCTCTYEKNISLLR